VIYTLGSRPPNRQPNPGEHIWLLRNSGRQVDCQFRFHGESYGWECQGSYDGDLADGRRLKSKRTLRGQAQGRQNGYTIWGLLVYERWSRHDAAA
jgi:hypothetical protein